MIMFDVSLVLNGPGNLLGLRYVRDSFLACIYMTVAFNGVVD